MGKYDDIINLPHHNPRNHSRMSTIARAAQFASFAALTGYEDIIFETGRMTDTRPELDELQLRQLDESISLIQDTLQSRPKVVGIRFIPDPIKAGGSFSCFEGRVRNIDQAASILVISDGTSIPLQDICELHVCE